MRDGRFGGTIMIEMSSIDNKLTVGCTMLLLRDETSIDEIRPHFLHQTLMSLPPPFVLPGFIWDPVYVDLTNKEEAALLQATKSASFQPNSVPFSPTRATH